MVAIGNVCVFSGRYALRAKKKLSIKNFCHSCHNYLVFYE